MIVDKTKKTKNIIAKKEPKTDKYLQERQFQKNNILNRMRTRRRDNKNIFKKIIESIRYFAKTLLENT